MLKNKIVVVPLVLIIVFISSEYCMPVLLSLLRRVSFAMAESQARAYSSGSLSMAFVTVPDMETAKKISSHLVTNKLAACVNIIPQVKSIYEWEGKVQEDEELILMIKTATTKIDDISDYIRKNHPYDVAEVISSLIDNGNPPYLDWVAKTVALSTAEPDAKKSKETDM